MKTKGEILSIGIVLMLVFSTTLLVANANEGYKVQETDQDQLDQYANNTSSNGNYFPANVKIAQSFTPTLPVLTKIKLALRTWGNPSDLTCHIRDDLQGENLTTASISSQDIPEHTDTWVEIDLSETQVNPGEKHYIVLSAGPDYNSDQTFAWIIDSDSNYSGGKKWKYIDAYSTWDMADNLDMCFETYGKNSNQPPLQPSNPSPENSAQNIDLYVELNWDCSDPENDDITYDVYLEAEDDTPDDLVAYDLIDSKYTHTGLDYETQYYWQVVATDEHGNSTDGPVWSFKTSKEEDVNDVSMSFSILNTDGLKTVVENIGDSPFYCVQYLLTIKGGIFNRINATEAFADDDLQPGETMNVSIEPENISFGLGSVNVTMFVYANGKLYREQRNGIILGRMIILFGR